MGNYRITTISYPSDSYSPICEEDFRTDIGVIDKKWRGQSTSTEGKREIRYKNLTPYQVETIKTVARAHFPKTVRIGSRVYKD